MRLRSAVLLLSLAAPPAAPGQSRQSPPKPTNTSTPSQPKPAPSTPVDARAAAQALRDKLPDVAAARLSKLLASSKGPQPAARLLLTEALVRSGLHADALREAAHPDLKGLPDAAFWQGIALAGLGRWNDALTTLATLPAEGFPWATEAAFSRASITAAAGDPDTAVATLAPFLTNPAPDTAARARLWSAEFQLAANRPAEAAALIAPLSSPPPAFTAPLRYLRARLALAAGKPEDALTEFDALADGGRGITPQLQHAAMLGMARSLAARNQPDEALGVLEKLIGQSPPPARSTLVSAFDEFSRLNRPPRAEADSYLRGWAESDQPDLRTLANLARAAALEAAGKPADALAICRNLTASNSGSALLPWIILQEARTALAAGDRTAASRTLTTLEPLAATPVLRAWCSWLKGVTAYDDAKFTASAAAFTAAARDAAEPEARTAAAWNAAIADLRSGILDPAEPLRVIDGINTPAARTAAAEFHLERALYMAATGKEGARDSLKAFVDALPGHPRHFDALTALVELSLTEQPPDPKAAKQWARAASTAAVSPAEKETAAWLEARATGAVSGDDALAQAAATFIAAYPESPRRSPLRMQLGEMQFRRQNFAAARQLFEALAKDDPLHPLAEAALFWAGKAALLSLGQKSENDAIALWEEVHKRNGPLSLEARLQVALVTLRRGDHTTALQYLAGILDHSPPPDPPTRFQALCLRGEVLVAQNAAPDKIKDAMAAFDAVAADPAASTVWKHEAIVRKGVCLEQLKRSTDALDAYHLVLSAPPAAEGPEEYWFHRAGEKALRLLESNGKFEEAVEMAKKMSKAPGPRGRAAAALVSRLALKYGIWLDDAPAAPPAPTPP